MQLKPHTAVFALITGGLGSFAAALTIAVWLGHLEPTTMIQTTAGVTLVLIIYTLIMWSHITATLDAIAGPDTDGDRGDGHV